MSSPRGRALAVLTLLVVIAGGAWFVVSRGTTGATHPVSARSAEPAQAHRSRGHAQDARPKHHAPTAPGPINATFAGLTTFRGNATRDYYGAGPLPRHPVVRWRYPATGGLCSRSSDLFGTETWCGTGWTGQPNVIVHKHGTIEIREGAYDDDYHFWNGVTGKPLRSDLHTGDLAKGSATSDSDGYPLYYGGSRDNHLRVIAMDRSRPTVLWSVDAHDVPHLIWNDDWDAAPLQIGDYLLEGGENSWFYVIRLHRHYNTKGRVEVNPKIVMLVPGWDAKLGEEVHDEDISIEDSVAFFRGIVYFANGGGLVQGWDISNILRGGHRYRRVFRFWDGDDTDSTIVIDPHGYLYVSRHIEENVPRPESMPRDHQLGGLMKLNPHNPRHPVLWSVPIGNFERDGGSLSTPALYKGVVYDAATDGQVIAVDQRTGKRFWQIHLPPPTIASPVTIDNQMVLGDCAGGLHDYDIANPRVRPKLLWTVHLDGCIESTPAVWHGMLWVGARGGQFYGIGDRGPHPIKP